MGFLDKQMQNEKELIRLTSAKEGHYGGGYFYLLKLDLTWRFSAPTAALNNNDFIGYSSLPGTALDGWVSCSLVLPFVPLPLPLLSCWGAVGYYAERFKKDQIHNRKVSTIL